ERLGDFLDLAQVDMNLFAGVVDGFQRCAGQLELTTGFQRNVTAPVLQSHGPTLLLHGLPAKAGQCGEKSLDTAFAIEWQRAQRLPVEYELLVVRAQPPAARRFAGILERLDKLAAVGERLTAGLRRRRHVLSKWRPPEL